MEPEFDERALERALSELQLWKQLFYLLLVCRRLFPSFELFCRESSHEGANILRDAITLAENKLLAGVSRSDLDEVRAACEGVAPETEEYESILVSSALDSAIATSLLMKAFASQQTKSVVEGVALARDSVDMYVQEIESMNPEDIELENRILAHPLMQQELRRQREALEFLRDLGDDIAQEKNLLEEKLIEREGDSCLKIGS